MNRFTSTWRWVLGLVPVVALLWALLPTAAVAATTKSGNNVTINASQVINDDLYIAGQTVNMNGTVTGNLIAMGSNVNVNGRIGGTVLAAGGTITVNGVVAGSAIVVGGNLDVTGRVGKDVTAVGGTVTLHSGATVGRDMLSAAGTTTVEGKIARDLRTAGNKVTLVSGASIGRDLIYRGTKPTIPTGVTVGGQVQHQSGAVFLGWSNAELQWFSVPGWLMWLRLVVGLLALGLLFVWLAPRYSRRTVANLETHWLASLGLGFAVLFLAPILAALIFGIGLLIGGWWLGLIGLFVYVVAIVLAVTVAGFAAVVLGTKRAGQPMPLWAAMICGVVLISLVGVVPFVGWLACALGMIWALGGLAMTLFQRPSTPAVLPPVISAPVDESFTPTPPLAGVR